MDDENNPEAFIRTIQDESDAQNIASSPLLPEEQFGVITPNISPVTSVKKVVIQVDKQVSDRVFNLVYDRTQRQIRLYEVRNKIKHTLNEAR